MKTDHILKGQSKGDRNATTDKVLPPGFAFNNAAPDLAANMRTDARRFHECRRIAENG